MLIRVATATFFLPTFQDVYSTQVALFRGCVFYTGSTFSWVCILHMYDFFRGVYSTQVRLFQGVYSTQVALFQGCVFYTGSTFSKV